jgi:hypothetical protein
MQQSLASQSVFEKYGRKSRRELFLDEMEKVVSWSGLEALVRPHYAKAGKGRRPVGLSIMLRTYFVQQWFNLSDPGVEEALYESAALRRFVGVDLGVAPAPDETTVLRFRHMLEQHDLGGLMLDAVNLHLEAKGIRIQTGTIVDATILHAPSSTKNASGERDPERHQTRKGQQWYFGLKAHVGVDAKQGPRPLGGAERGQRCGLPHAAGVVLIAFDWTADFQRSWPATVGVRVAGWLHGERLDSHTGLYQMMPLNLRAAFAWFMRERSPHLPSDTAPTLH